MAWMKESDAMETARDVMGDLLQVRDYKDWIYSADVCEETIKILDASIEASEKRTEIIDSLLLSSLLLCTHIQRMFECHSESPLKRCLEGMASLVGRIDIFLDGKEVHGEKCPVCQGDAVGISGNSLMEDIQNG